MTHPLPPDPARWPRRNGDGSSARPHERPPTSSRTLTWTATELAVAAGLVCGEVVDLSQDSDCRVRATVLRDLLLRRWPPGWRASADDPRGVQLVGADVVGRLDLDHVETSVPLVLRSGRLVDGVSARFGHLRYLALTDLALGTAGQPLPALDGTGLEVDGVLSLAGTEAASAADDGTVRLSGAHIRQQLNLTAAVLIGSAGPALQADTLVADHDVALSRVTASVTSSEAAVRLRHAYVGGRLSISPDAVLSNLTGPALDAEGLRVDGDCFLSGITAIGEHDDGTVRLTGAHLAGQLDLSRALLTNGSGSALVADGLVVGDSAVLTGVRACADSRDAAVRLVGARIDGQLDLGAAVDGSGLVPASLSNPAGPALAADGTVVDDDLVLTGLRASGSGRRATLRLAHTHVGGLLVGDFAAVTSATGPDHRMVVEGLTYRGVPGATATAWLDLLGHATPTYTAQPYRHLAAATAATGHDHQTRQVLIAQRRDQLHRAARTPTRLWGWLTWWTLGYGYQPWRALVWLSAVAGAAAGLTLWLGGWGLQVRDHPEQGCTATERVLVGLDTTLPVISTPVTDRCVPRPTSAAGHNQKSQTCWRPYDLL